MTLAPYNICILASIRKNQIWGCSRNSFYCYYCLCVCVRGGCCIFATKRCQNLLFGLFSVFLLSIFTKIHRFESRSCWDLEYEDEKYKGDGCYKGQHCHHEHCFDEVGILSLGLLQFANGSNDVGVKMGGQHEVCFEEVVGAVGGCKMPCPPAGDHLHLQLPELQRLEHERHRDHRCAGHRWQWSPLLQGHPGQLRSDLLPKERDNVRLL